MKKLCFVALFTFGAMFVLSSFDAHASSVRCPRHEIKTSMKNKLYKTRIFRGTTKGFTDYTQGHSRGNSRTLGFVEYRGLTTSVKTDFDVVEVGQGYYCVKMTRVQGSFNMRPKLFMPTDYSRKSCEYQQILKHEKRHLKVLKNFHTKYSKKFEAHMGRIARDVPISRPVKTQEEVNAVAAGLDMYFVNNFKEFELKAWNLMQAQQAKIDSPQEYIGVSKRCKNW